MVKRRSIVRIVVALLVALATALTAIAIVHARRDGAPRPHVLFVGDSYPAGAGVLDVRNAYPEMIAQEANWNLHVDAQGGTGFIVDGRGTDNDRKASDNSNTLRLIDRLAADKQNFPKVDILIVDAGRNDGLHPPDERANAISEYLTEARKKWPSAKIVEIIPAYVWDSKPYNGYAELLDKVSASVFAVGGTLIDPIAEGWYAHIDLESMVIGDGVHPDWRGNAYIADRLIASLRQRGIIPAV